MSVILAIIFAAVLIAIAYGIYSLSVSQKYKEKCPRAWKIIIAFILALLSFNFFLPLIRILNGISASFFASETMSIVSLFADAVGIICSIWIGLIVYRMLTDNGKVERSVLIVIYVIMNLLCVFSAYQDARDGAFLYMVFDIGCCVAGAFQFFKMQREYGINQ